MKQKVEKSSLKLDDFVLKYQLKSSMYVDSSLHGDLKKDKLIDELNFKNCMCCKRNKTGKCFVGIKVKERKFIIHAEYFDSNNIFSHP